MWFWLLELLWDMVDEDVNEFRVMLWSFVFFLVLLLVGVVWLLWIILLYFVCSCVSLLYWVMMSNFVGFLWYVIFYKCLYRGLFRLKVLLDFVLNFVVYGVVMFCMLFNIFLCVYEYIEKFCWFLSFWFFG